MPDEKERFEILLEHMDRKFDVIAEGHQTLDRKIDVLSSKVDTNHDEIKNQLSLVETNLRKQIEGNREAIDAHDKKLDRVIGKIEDHEVRIGRLEAV